MKLYFPIVCVNIAMLHNLVVCFAMNTLQSFLPLICKRQVIHALSTQSGSLIVIKASLALLSHVFSNTNVDNVSDSDSVSQWLLILVSVLDVVFKGEWIVKHCKKWSYSYTIPWLQLNKVCRLLSWTMDGDICKSL